MLVENGKQKQALSRPNPRRESLTFLRFMVRKTALSGRSYDYTTLDSFGIGVRKRYCYLLHSIGILRYYPAMAQNFPVLPAIR